MIKEKRPSSSSSSSSSKKPKNFHIPNFTPVLQCYDVPEPMIYPPGSNPVTFKNPNPDKGCGFTPVSSMDIDPSVAVTTCYEIFSKTSDLTVSEHAGVSLSEHPTMVSKATSDCFASLEVLDQETVNYLDKFKQISPMDVDSHVVVESSGESDVVVRKVENGVVAATNGTKSKIGCSFVCDVCNVTCNSEKTLEIHKEGKAHMRKSKNLQVSSATKQEPPSPKTNGILYHADTNGILYHESEKRLQDLLAPKPKPPYADTNGILDQEFQKRPQVSLATKQDPPSPKTNGILYHESEKRLQDLLAPKPKPPSPDTNGILDQGFEKRPQVSLATKQDPPSPYTNGILDQVSEKSPQVSAATKQERPSLDANGFLDQVPETKNQSLLQKEASLGSLFFCSIPDLDSIKQKIQSIATEEVTVPSCMDQFPNSTPLSTTLHQPCNGLAQNNNRELKIHQPVSCEASKVSRSGDKFLEGHNPRKEDLKNHEALEEIKSPPLITTMQSIPVYKTVEDLKSTENKNTGDSAASKGQWCEVCKISCTGDDINHHLIGKKHLKNLRNSVLKPNSSLAVESQKLPECEVVDPINEENPFWCEVCQISCNSQDVLQSHLSGKKHKKKMEKPETTLFGLGLPPASSSIATKPLHDPPSDNKESSKRKGPMISSPAANGEDVNNTKRQKKASEEGRELTCMLCDVVCNSPEGFRDHIGSEQHSARNRSTLCLMA